METFQDHFIGSEVFDIKNFKKISYTKTTPYRFVSSFETLNQIDDPLHIHENCLTKILEYESLFINKQKAISLLKIWYDSDIKQIYGYSIVPSEYIPYSQASSLGVFYNCPEVEVVKKMYDKDYDMIIFDNYIELDGNCRYFNLNIRTSGLESIEYFSELENFENIRKIVRNFNTNGLFPVTYMFDLQNRDIVGINIDTNFIPYDLTDEDIFFKRNAEYYLNKKIEYYSKFVDANILTKEQYDYIFEVSPGAEKTCLKFRWENKNICHIELESYCVKDFTQVWTRT